MKKLAKIAKIIAITSVMLSLAGCARSPVGGRDYNANQVRQMGSADNGVVTAMRSINIHENRGGASNYAGPAIGGIAGAVLGAQVRDPNARRLATVIGGIAGGIAGNQIQAYTGKQAGVELDIRLDSGKRILAAQAADEQFAVGDYVRVTRMGGAYRVTH